MPDLNLLWSVAFICGQAMAIVFLTTTAPAEAKSLLGYLSHTNTVVHARTYW